MALGGVIDKPDEYSDNVAVTNDGGSTWTLAGRPSFSGAVYGAAYVPGAPTPTLVGVGPNGMAYSADNGMTWTNLDTRSHWSVAFASLRSGWAVGPEGRVTHIRLFEQPDLQQALDRTALHCGDRPSDGTAATADPADVRAVRVVRAAAMSSAMTWPETGKLDNVCLARESRGHYL